MLEQSYKYKCIWDDFWTEFLNKLLFNNEKRDGINNGLSYSSINENTVNNAHTSTGMYITFKTISQYIIHERNLFIYSWVAIIVNYFIDL